MPHSALRQSVIDTPRVPAPPSPPPASPLHQEKESPMGLDWMLHARKPKPACEDQFRCINDKLNALDDDESLSVEEEKQLRRDLELALEQVSISPYQVIGAPRVGIDQQA